jgi:hypothetical protein
MKKRLLSVLLVAILLTSVLPFTAAVAGSLSNFTQVNTYQSGPVHGRAVLPVVCILRSACL